MSASRTFRRQIGLGASCLMIAAATVGMSAPSASAATSPDGKLSLIATPPPGGYVVGVSANIGLDGIVGSMYPIPQGSWVTLSDNGTCFNSYWPGMDPTGSGSEQWTPTTAGTHAISVTHWGRTVSETVTVSPAPDGAPVPTPETPGCNGGGSLSVFNGLFSGSLGSLGF